MLRGRSSTPGGSGPPRGTRSHTAFSRGSSPAARPGQAEVAARWHCGSTEALRPGRCWGCRRSRAGAKTAGTWAAPTGRGPNEPLLQPAGFCTPAGQAHGNALHLLQRVALHGAAAVGAAGAPRACQDTDVGLQCKRRLPCCAHFSLSDFFFFFRLSGSSEGKSRSFTAAAQNCQGVKDFWTEEPSPAAGSCSVRQ